ncbi:porin [Rhodoferax sp.]|uniref:porin n=1 Tax=Rhodoferax sp. TaxID=50421 RepID=UPI0025DAE08A|nr:porin [Rhodoferax sp.]
MKKSLVALAVLAASGAAMAQSSVTLYGVVDVFVGSSSTTNKGNVAVPSLRQTVETSGSVNGSRWGLKGSEDLGGGLNAVFDLQSGFSLDTGASGQGASGVGLLFGRQAIVGLQGGFGKVVVGRVITPFYDNEGMNDSMLNGSLSAQSNVMRTANGFNTFYDGKSGPTIAGVATGALANYVLRANNAVRYDTPNIAGFVGAVAYSLAERTQTNFATNIGISVVSTSLVYANGPLSGVLAYQSEKPFSVFGTATDRNYTRLSGQYDFGKIIAKAGYGRVKNVDYVKDASTSEYQIGLDFKVTDAFLLTGGVAQSKDNLAAGDVKRTAYALGYKYTMSKRTFLYGGYESGVGKVNGSPDAKQNIFALGVQHRF